MNSVSTCDGRDMAALFTYLTLVNIAQIYSRLSPRCLLVPDSRSLLRENPPASAKDTIIGKMSFNASQDSLWGPLYSFMPYRRPDGSYDHGINDAYVVTLATCLILLVGQDV